MNSLSPAAQLQSSILQGELDNVSESEKYIPKLGIKSFSLGRARLQKISFENFKKTPSQGDPA